MSLFSCCKKKTRPMSMVFCPSAPEFAGRISVVSDDGKDVLMRHFEYEENTDDFDTFKVPCEADKLLQKVPEKVESRSSVLDDK
ncbi:hypothetical protein SS50377_27184 [Spironucleus salmonicida]|uniref:Uncharacterized protein n=1 Tax=Spironucleus salmonicida TaxID=348837 RepID=V6LZ90_9EUKA|nr:hypothetical protein SS50377_27184 [Spironucleus salmonicida]|eukprot:EST49598.1 Hypothetical protein SS50377_10041 [Spironucleus salmonicida]